MNYGAAAPKEKPAEAGQEQPWRREEKNGLLWMIVWAETYAVLKREYFSQAGLRLMLRHDLEEGCVVDAA